MIKISAKYLLMMKKINILTIDTTNPEKTAILLGEGSPIAAKNRSSAPPWRTSLNIRPRSPACGGIHARSASHCFFYKGLIKILAKKVWRARTHQSEELLPAIDKLLKQNKVLPKNLGLIIVNTGPGSFTGTRVGVATANALSFGLNIPVVGVKAEDSKIEVITSKGWKMFSQTKIKKGAIAKPFYDKAPNITKPKLRKNGVY